MLDPRAGVDLGVACRGVWIRTYVRTWACRVRVRMHGYVVPERIVSRCVDIPIIYPRQVRTALSKCECRPSRCGAGRLGRDVYSCGRGVVSAFAARPIACSKSELGYHRLEIVDPDYKHLRGFWAGRRKFVLPYLPPPTDLTSAPSSFSVSRCFWCIRFDMACSKRRFRDPCPKGLV